MTTGRYPLTRPRRLRQAEFIRGLADAATVGDTTTLSNVLMQPIAAADVSAALAEVAASAPVDGVIELAGPEQLRLDDLARRVLAAAGDARTVRTDPAAGYFGGTVTDASLIPEQDDAITDHRYGSTTFSRWLEAGH